MVCMGYAEGGFTALLDNNTFLVAPTISDYFSVSFFSLMDNILVRLSACFP